MAEYNDVIKQFKRMCRYYNGQEFDCPLYCKGHGCNISHCRMLAFDDKKFQNVVMSWAAEHPVVYPTWENWLTTMGVQSYNELSKPIPDDIAQKLGIEPKEVI